MEAWNENRIKTIAFAAIAGIVVAGFCYMIGAIIGLEPIDDAYITYRHVKNFAEGHGLVFNVGERVEATSNFLFALILGWMLKMGIAPQTGGMILNLASIWVIVFLIYFDASKRKIIENGNPGGLIAGALFVALFPSITIYLWDGLETLFLTALFFGGCYSFLYRNQIRWGLILAGLFWGLAACVRMEAVIALPVAGLLLLLEKKQKAIGEIIFIGIGFAVVFIPTLAWRWNFYGYPFPNTYYVKVDGGSLLLAFRGLRYSIGYLLMYLSSTLIILGALMRLKRVAAERQRTGFLLGIIGIYFLYIVYVGGDYFPYYRFFVPITPIIAMLFSDLALFGPGKNPKTQAGIPRLSTGKTIAAVLVFLIITNILAMAHLGQLQLFLREQNSAKIFAYTGKQLGKKLPPDTVLMLGAAGAMPYYSNLKTYDFYGLTNVEIAHREVTLGTQFPGHEKWDISLLNKFAPDIIIITAYWKEERKGDKLPPLIAAHFNHFKDLEILQKYQLAKILDPRIDLFIYVKKDAANRFGGIIQPVLEDKI